MRAKIVAAGPLEFFPDQRQRLEKLGEVTFHEKQSKTPEEWFERVKGYDVILSGKFGLKDKWHLLHDVFISLPFVAVSWLDIPVMKKRNITVSNSPGCNRHAVSEWIIGMMIVIARQLDKFINVEGLSADAVRSTTMGLAGKNITILGKGNVGTRVGEIAEALEMNVSYFQRSDKLAQKVRDADIIVDSLGSNPSTVNILNKDFFNSVKKAVIFITVTGETIVDIDAMLAALDEGRLSYVAHDSGGILIGDTSDPFYQRLLKHPKVYVTPHIAYNTDVERRVANDIMIDNVEAWLKGKPINLVK